MIPIGKLGRVNEGDYKNWYVMVHDTPGMGLLVVKALDAEMSNTKLFHGPLARRARRGRSARRTGTWRSTCRTM